MANSIGPDPFIGFINGKFAELRQHSRRIQEIVYQDIFTGALTEDITSIRAYADKNANTLGQLKQWSDSVRLIGYSVSSDSEKEELISAVDGTIIRTGLMYAMLTACINANSNSYEREELQAARVMSSENNKILEDLFVKIDKEIKPA